MGISLCHTGSRNWWDSCPSQEQSPEVSPQVNGFGKGHEGEAEEPEVRVGRWAMEMALEPRQLLMMVFGVSIQDVDFVFQIKKNTKTHHLPCNVHVIWQAHQNSSEAAQQHSATHIGRLPLLVAVWFIFNDFHGLIAV